MTKSQFRVAQIFLRMTSRVLLGAEKLFRRARLKLKIFETGLDPDLDTWIERSQQLADEIQNHTQLTDLLRERVEEIREKNANNAPLSSEEAHLRLTCPRAPHISGLFYNRSEDVMMCPYCGYRQHEEMGG